jgi:undecaprenyl-diphosphatase
MDLAILYFFNVTMATPILDIFFVNICDFDIWRWPLALVGIALLWKGGPGGRRVVASAVIAALIIDPSVYRLLKPLFGRLRPCHEPLLDWIRAIDGCGGRYGFPSSHAANAFGVTVVFSAFYRTAKYYFIPLAILISAGRVFTSAFITRPTWPREPFSASEWRSGSFTSLPDFAVLTCKGIFIGIRERDPKETSFGA